ncbi:hypothetical protein [Streptomyces virginiae]|uniref:hypothetical protein n=1 Tax=Streptomyces virginiae TaxID=1961 RepID=UPI0036FDCD20
MPRRGRILHRPPRPHRARVAAGSPDGVLLAAAQSEFPAVQSASSGHVGHELGQYVQLPGPIGNEALRDAVACALDKAPRLWFRLLRGRRRPPGQAPVRAPGSPRRPALLGASGAADPVAAALGPVRGRLARLPRPQPSSTTRRPRELRPALPRRALWRALRRGAGRVLAGSAGGARFSRFPR